MGCDRQVPACWAGVSTCVCGRYAPLFTLVLIENLLEQVGCVLKSFFNKVEYVGFGGF